MTDDHAEPESVAMTNQPKKGLINIILVWMIGLALGISAGAITAMLLLPGSDDSGIQNSIADYFRH